MTDEIRTSDRPKRPDWEHRTTTTDPVTGETITIAEWKDRMESGVRTWQERERAIQRLIYGEAGD